MIPYKNRKVVYTKPVRVYRNLTFTKGWAEPDSGPWYSIRQGDHVVAHAREVSLMDCTFIVQEPGRQRVLATGQKNVHAFVQGFLVPGPFTRDLARLRARYNPKAMDSFQVELTHYGPCRAFTWQPLKAAKCAYLDARGIHVDL